MIFIKWLFLAWKVTRAITEQQGCESVAYGSCWGVLGEPKAPFPSLGVLAHSGFVTGVLLSCIPLMGFLLHYMALGMLNGGGSIFHPLPFSGPPVFTLFMVALGPWLGSFLLGQYALIYPSTLES